MLHARAQARAFCCVESVAGDSFERRSQCKKIFQTFVKL
ncbi:hypothetical protein BRAS3809_7710013 [Bradyrhizobium sp. STM 3809]|nr:hypothetical protein BRAS3809_7710013 [Bradyrhizobium sp. STM 3809]